MNHFAGITKMVLLLALAGCATTPAPSTGTPGAVANVGAAVARMQADGKAMREVVNALTEKTWPAGRERLGVLCDSLDRHGSEASRLDVDAQHRAERDAKTIAAQAKQIAEMKATDPVRTALRWTATALIIGGIILAIVGAVKLGRSWAGLGGLATVCGAGIYAFQRWLEPISLVVLCSVGAMAVLYLVHVYRDWRQTGKLDLTPWDNEEMANRLSDRILSIAPAKPPEPEAR